MGVALTTLEQSRLAELEATVRHGLQTFVEVGNALTEIRDARLYRQTHRTFRDYCGERFGFSDSRGRQLIAAAKTVTDVTLRGLPAPKSEGEARELARRLRAEADALDGGQCIAEMTAEEIVADAILAKADAEAAEAAASAPHRQRMAENFAELVTCGWTHQQIAKRFKLSEHTVRVYVTRAS